VGIAQGFSLGWRLPMRLRPERTRGLPGRISTVPSGGGHDSARDPTLKRWAIVGMSLRDKSLLTFRKPLSLAAAEHGIDKNPLFDAPRVNENWFWVPPILAASSQTGGRGSRRGVFRSDAAAFSSRSSNPPSLRQVQFKPACPCSRESFRWHRRCRPYPGGSLGAGSE